MARATEDARIILHDLSVCLIHGSTLDNPKFLVCGHTFCKVCLERFCRAHNWMNESGVITKSIECPVCRELTKTDGKIDDLPNNLYAKKLTELQSILPGLSPHDPDIGGSIVSCGLCKQLSQLCSATQPISNVDNVEYVCFECHEYFCGNCFTQRHKVNCSDHKQWVRLHDDLSELSQHQCKSHQQLYSSYCTDCNVGFCKMCQLMGHHSDHRTVHSLNEEVTREFVQKIFSSRETLKRVTEEGGRCTMNLQDEFGRIRNHFAEEEMKLKMLRKELKKGIDEWYGNMQEERETQRRAEEKQLRILQEGINFYRSGCQSLVEYVNKIESKPQRLPLYLYSDLNKRVRSVISDQFPSLPPDLGQTSFSSFEKHEFNQFLTDTFLTRKTCDVDVSDELVKTALVTTNCNAGVSSLGATINSADREAYKINSQNTLLPHATSRRSVEAHSPESTLRSTPSTSVTIPDANRRAYSNTRRGTNSLDFILNTNELTSPVNSSSSDNKTQRYRQSSLPDQLRETDNQSVENHNTPAQTHSVRSSNDLIKVSARSQSLPEDTVVGGHDRKDQGANEVFKKSVGVPVISGSVQNKLKLFENLAAKETPCTNKERKRMSLSTLKAEKISPGSSMVKTSEHRNRLSTRSVPENSLSSAHSHRSKSLQCLNTQPSFDGNRPTENSSLNERTRVRALYANGGSLDGYDISRKPTHYRGWKSDSHLDRCNHQVAFQEDGNTLKCPLDLSKSDKDLSINPTITGIMVTEDRIIV